jgi:DNA-binding cell septation regulator SpoVG
MKVMFTAPRSGGPQNLLAEAEIVFDSAGPSASGQEALFDGLKLCGISVWQGDRGVFVTVPNRAFGAGSERRYFDYLRSVAHPGTPEARDALNNFKARIAADYKAWANGHDKAGATRRLRRAPVGDEQY